MGNLRCEVLDEAHEVNFARAVVNLKVAVFFFEAITDSTVARKIPPSVSVDWHYKFLVSVEPGFPLSVPRIHRTLIYIYNGEAFSNVSC